MKKVYIKSIAVLYLAMLAYLPVNAQMSGTYTVGSGGTYTSLTSAYNALVSAGINGPVVLSVISNLSGNQSLSGSVSGASTTNTITITDSNNSFTIGTNSNYALQFSNGVNNVIVKDINIGDPSYSNQYAGIYFNTSSTPHTNIEFRNCQINAYEGATGGNYYAVYYSGSSSSYYLNNVRFIKNTINGGYYNFYLYYTSGNSTNMASRGGVTIDSNTLTNAYYYGIYSYYYGYYPSISYNTIISRNSSGSYYGICCEYYTTIDTVTGNKVSITSSGQVFGLRFYNYQNYNSSYGANGPMFISNNEIRILSSSSTSYGLYCYQNSQFDIYHNSIYVNGTSTCYGAYFDQNSTSYKTTFKNNIIHINSTSSQRPIYFGSTNFSSSYCTLDYNNYYTTGGSTNYYGRTSYNTLSTWQTACSQETNSTTLALNYIDLSNSMELSGYTGLSCLQVSGVTKDIRNNTRTSTCFKGCYEPFMLDAEVNIGNGTTLFGIINQPTPINTKLTNRGLSTITTANIGWSFKDTVRTSIPYSGSLLMGADTNLALGNVTPTYGSTNAVKIWVNSVNSTSDPNHSNDTIMFNIFGCDSALSGTYTIGGTGADFATINDAIAPLMNCGISGPVTFQINSGIYNESIIISGSILGASITNKVLFTSTAGHADSVQVYVAGTSCILSDVSFVNFSDITLGTTASTGEKAVVLNGNCSNIEFYRCNIYAYTSATAESYIPVYYSNSTAGKYLSDVKFIKNNIKGGYVNMCFFTSSSIGTSSFGSVTIDSNTMTEGYRGGFTRSTTSTQAYYMYFSSISYNTVIGRAAGSGWQYGICFGSVYQPPGSYPSYYDVVGMMVNNKINLQVTGNYGCGIWLGYYFNYYSPTGSSGNGTQCLVANNEIIHNSTSCYSYGIYGYYSKANIINNSIYLRNTITSYQLYGMYLYNNSTSYGPMTIKNNNIVVIPQNADNGFPIYLSDGAQYATNTYKIIDYNNYYSSGGLVGYIDGSISNLKSIRSITGQDQGSTSQYPFYENIPNNLKEYGFNFSCPSFTGLTYDIENTNRGTTTVMGAYHFTPYVNYDIQPFSLITPSTIVVNGIDEPVSIRLMNVGINTVTSATINWKFNGVSQTPINWSGSVSSGNSVVVPIDTITPVSGKNTLAFITSMPNNQADTILFNDTLSVDLFGCDSALQGTYTVGSGGQFADVTEAVEAINSCGMSGPVTFALLSGNYPPLIISGVLKGTSTINTVTFTSAAGHADSVIIGNSTTSSTTALTLANAAHLIFKDVTIGLPTSYTGYGVELKGLCENILFYGCTIQTNKSGTGSNYIGVRYNGTNSSTMYLSNVRFIKNTITGGYYNFYFNYASGNNVPMRNRTSSIIIDSNVISNAYAYGLYISWMNRLPSISHNSIVSRNNTTTTYYGIYSYYYNTIDSMIGNKFNISGTSNCYGIYVSYYQNYHNDYGASGPMFIANNEVIVSSGSNTSYAFYDGSGSQYSKFDILHNSFYVSGTSTKYGVYLYPYSTSYKTTFLNNNVYVSTTGTGNMIYFGSTSYNTTSYCTIDYNNYYKPSGTAYYGNSYTSLSAWSSAKSQDIHSTNTDPGFGSTPTNLIPTNWSMCPVLNEVASDINGSPRIGITYKGCYTAVFNLDAGITEFIGIGPKVSAGTNAINVRLMNYGTDTLRSISVQCSVDGITQTAVNLSGLSLTQYQDTVITIGSFVVSVNTTYNLKAWTFNPNSSTDQNINNDTVSHSTVGCIQVLNGTYDVGGGNNDFANITAAMSALTTCGVSGPVILRLASGNYTTLNSFNTVYSGTNATNTVTFTSLTSNANDVRIGATSSNALALSGAKYLRFENVTIGDTTGGTTYGVYFQNSNENIDFYRCNIYSSVTTTSTSYIPVYYYASSSGQCLKNVRFIANNIKGGYVNMCLYSSSSVGTNNMGSITIDSNIMTQGYRGGFSRSVTSSTPYYMYFPSISYNIIIGRATSSSYQYGISLGSVYSNPGNYLSNYDVVDKMVGNKINLQITSNYGCGISLGYYLNYYTYDGIGDGGTQSLIANNEIIHSSANGQTYGIYSMYSKAYLLHNSIYLNSNSSSSMYGMYISNTSTSYGPMTIKNNILSIHHPVSYPTSGYPIYFQNGGVYLTQAYKIIDGNNYYSTGNYVGYAGNNITSLAAMQNVTGQDTYSISQNPGFLNPSINLHTSGSTLLVKPLSLVSVDLEGKARTMITNIGCYHDFLPLTLDVKLESILSPTSLTPGVTAPISVNISNFGSTSIDSVNIYCRVNGGATQVYHWTNGPLALFNTSSSISLGTFVPVSGNNSIEVYVAQPNGSSDLNTANDTLKLNIYACDSILSTRTYTVGTGGYFTNESELINTLTHCGISGPIVVEFITGSYGSMNITNIPGSSTSNTVTFTSVSGNASDVNIGSGGSALSLNQSSNLIFKNLTLGSTTGVTTYGVEMQGMCENILFYGCNINSDINTTSSSYIPVIYNSSNGSTYYLKNVNFIKNNINGGYYNMLFNYPAGSSSNMSSSGMSVVIDSNTMTNSYYSGFYSNYYARYPSISYNTISSRSSGNVTSSWYGININIFHNIDSLIGNKIKSNNISVSYPYGIYISQYYNYTSYNGSGSGIIANNEINLYASGSAYGIYVYYPYSNVKVIHNSIFINGTANGYGLYLYNQNNSYHPVIKNNISAMFAGTSSYPIYYNGSYYNTSYYDVDYNNYYSTGSYIAYANGSISTLSSLRLTTLQDNNSLSEDPGFINSTLNLQTSGNTMIVTPLINYDINGTIRQAVTNMGCYHDFKAIALDAKLESIVSPTQNMTIGLTTPVEVKITNFGTTNLDSVKIYWSVNGATPNVYNWTNGPLTFFNTTPTITIGTFVPKSGQNTITIYVSQPNGAVDSNTINDTLSVGAYCCDSLLSGVYTVGTGSDFNDETEVMTALYKCGIKGPVVFRYTNGTYGGLTFSAVPGSSSSNTITFTSVSGNADDVKFLVSLGDALLLNSTANLIFDHITFDASNDINGCGVKFMGLDSNILFTGCNIKANPNTINSQSAAVYYGNSSGSNKYLKNVNFINNKIDGGYYNIYLYYPASSTTYMASTGMSVVIDSNILTNSYNMGIYSYYYSRYPSISYNNISSRTAGSITSSWYGMYLYNYQNIDSIIGNKIRSSNINIQQPRGIYIESYFNSTSYNGTGSSLIANNEIHMHGSYTSGNYNYFCGMYISNPNANVNVYHNSIYLFNSTSTTIYGSCIYPYNSSTSYIIDLKNNNLVTLLPTGTSYYLYPLYFSSSTYAGSTYCTRDYNNYYNTNSTTIAYAGGTRTLSTLQSSYSQDANSVNVAPAYMNINNSLELKASGNSSLNCPRLSTILTDLRRNSRASTTYMGCYEPFNLDAAIDTASGTPTYVPSYQSISISASLLNAGINPLTSALITWQFKDTTRIPIPWSGLLASGSSANVSLGSIFPTPGFNNKVKIWVSNPNLTNDPNPSNDTITFNIFGCDTALRGVYTIGGPGADFANISEALLPATYCGIAGPVTFVLYSGVYNEAINLNKTIQGLSASNTITFVSAANHPDSVQIYFTGTTVYLSSISNIRFHYLTLGNTSNTAGRTVLFEGNCSDIDFYGCNIYSSITATSDASCGVYYSQSSGVTTCLNNVRFIKNTLSGGYANFYFYYGCGNSSYMANSSIIIDSNVMTEAYSYGVYTYYYTYFPSISHNTIVTRTVGATQYGLYLYYYCTINEVIGNRIKLQSTATAYGIYMGIFNNQNVYTNPTKVYNNEIVIPQASSCYGIRNQVCKIEFYHNTIYLSGSGNNYGIYLDQVSSGWPFYAKNNIIACLTSNINNGYAIYSNDPSYVLTINDCYLDYNNYYTTGNNLAYISGNISTLNNLRTYTGQDQHSTNKAPYFYDYPNSTRVYGYDMVGPRFNNILTDIENNARATTTTMGAYEFSPSLNLDIQPYALITPSSVLNKGITEWVSISLKNVGKDTITTATINWKFNNVAQSPVVWTGILLSGELAQITLDTVIPIAGINTFEFISSLPNSQPDSYVTNDTLTASLYACDSMLNGSYTVGSGGDFNNSDEIQIYLTNCGINGPVTFVFNAGTYAPLSLGKITGSSTVNTITFASASGNASDVIIGNSTQAATTALTLDGVSNLTFKNITIGLNSTFTGIAVEMKRMCENILFYECNIQTYQNGTSQNYCGVKYYSYSNATTYLSNVKFIKNNIDGGYYNFWFYYPAGTNLNMGTNGMSVIIDSNTLTNSYYSGIYSYWYAHYPSISFNTIRSRNTGSVTSNWYGMYLYYYHNVEIITGNKIQNTNTSITNPYGIYAYSYFNYSSYNGNGAGLITNNEVILYTTSNLSGIYLYRPNSNVQVLHNSVYMYGSGNAYALYVYNNSSSYQPVLKNNNLVCGGGTSSYPIYYNGNYSTSYYTVDHNNYYSSGSYIAYAGSTISSLAALQSATGQDANSTNADPAFSSPTSNLTPSNWSKCPILAEVPMDINGGYRLGLTYKGCYTAIFDRDAALAEFVGIGPRSTAGSNPIYVRIINVGRNTLTSVSVQASVNGVLQTPINISGLSLSQYKDTVINIGTFIASIGSTTQIAAWTYAPNGSSDQNVSNDTINISTIGCILVLNGTYDVGGGNNDFSTLNDAITALTNCGVSGPVVLRLASGTYNTLSSISGTYFNTNEINTVTFTSLNGNADSVIIGNASGAALTLSDAKHLIFYKVTIGNNNTTYGVTFTSTNENIEFNQCNINSNPTTTSSSYACVYYNNTSGSTKTLKKVRFIKNNINGGYYNFYMNYAGSSSSDMSSMTVTIDSNIMQNSCYYGIYSYEYAYYSSISYNTITSRLSGSASSTWYGIYFYWDHAVNKIVGNKIKSTNTSISNPYGIYIYYYLNNTGTSNRQPLIANNEIILYSASSNSGLYIYYPYSNVQILHNSIYMYGTGSPYGFYTYNSTTSYKPVLANNIFMTSAGTTAYPIYYNSNYYDINYFNVDYNNYYSTGLYVGYAGGPINSLAALQNATRQDANSLNMNPYFITPLVDLHTNGDEMLVDPLTQVPTDINNNTRTPITNMGCYHDFEPEDVDVKLLTIVNPVNAVASGQSSDLIVKIKNFGLNTIDSVKIHYVVNGIESVFDWYGSLAYNTGSPNILLGNFIPISGINTITVFTTDPNGTQDENTKNDTISITVFGCDSLLNGIYTVGTNGDFVDEKAVMMSLQYCGINGPVEFHFISGNYGQLNLSNPITGSSTTNTVLFTSAAGYAASVGFIASSGPALILNNVNNVFFHNVTLDGTTTNHGIELQGSCSNIEFYACHIKSNTTTTTSPYSAIYRNGMSGSNSLSDIRIIKNNISGGYYNIYWYYGGGGSSYMGNNCIIDSNIFTDAYYGAIYFNNSYTNFNSISYNNISCRSQNQSSNFYGIYFSYYNNIDYLLGNKIHIRNSAISYAYPIYVYYYNNHTNNSYGPMLIANNEIIVEVGNYCEGGINIYNNSPAEVINNSIHVSATSRAYGLRLYTNNSSYPIVAQNNNIFTMNASNNYPLYIEQASQMPYITLDYNNYASNGNYVGLVGAGHLSLASLRSATLQDTHSVAIQPNYLDLNTSLELLDYSGIVGARYPAVMTDINGLTRKMLTPMGAYSIDIYEGYNITANAIVEPVNTSDVFCYQDYASVRLAIQNTGSYLIDFSALPLSMHIEVTGAISYQYDTVLIIGGVAATQRDTFTVTDFLPVSSNGIYNIKVWVSLNADTLYNDDTIETVYSIDKIVLPYSINFNTYPNGLILKQNTGICQWSVQQGSGTNPVISPSHGTGRLEFNSSIGKGSVSTATLQPINLRGTSNPKLEFWYAHDNAPGRDYTDVKISVDGGYSYKSILNIQRFNPNYTTPGFAHYNIDLSAYATYSCVIIAFEAGSFGGGDQNIDSICVISSEDLALDLITTEQYDFVACELNNQTLAVTLTNLTSQDFNFTTKPTQIDVTVSGAVSKQYTIHLTSGYVYGDSIETYIVDTAFDFSTNGTYNITAVLKSIDDNNLNDTARSSRIINVDAELVYIHPIGNKTIGERVYPTVSVKNNGNMPIRNIPLHLLINHTSTILETIYIVLNPGDSVIYTFVNPYVVPTVNEAQPFYMLNIRTEVACDGLANNNSKSGFYNVILDKYIDLSITEVIKPKESVCDTGNTMVYPIVIIKNLGTQTANSITLYISIDSAGTLLKSYSEIISFISGQDSIEYTCSTAYRVPNFGKNYTFNALVNVDNDINTANNTKEVNACAIEKVNISERLTADWTLGQNIPNPAKDNVNIPYYIPKDGSINFKVMSITGQILHNETIEVTSGNHLMEFNTQNLSDGVYYYSMDYEGQRIVKKMSIQK